MRLCFKGATALALFLAVSLFYFWQPLSRGWVLLPATHFFDVYPWTHYKPINLAGSRNFLLGDVSALIYPYHTYNLVRLRIGEVALWNPYTWTGMPYLANGQSGLLDPLVLTFARLPLTPQDIPLWLALSRLTLIGFATWLWIRKLTDSYISGLIAGLVVMTSQFVIAWLLWPVTGVLVLFPLLLWAVECSVQKNRYAQLALATTTTAVFLPGHIETSFQCVLWALLYGVLRGSSKLRLVLGVILGILLAAPLLVPMAEYIVQSSAVELGRSRLAAIPFTTSLILGILGDWEYMRLYTQTLWAFVSPYAFGSPALGFYTLDFTNYNESIGYVSIVASIVSLMGLIWLWRDGTYRILFGLGVASVGVAFEAPFLHLVNFLPLIRIANNQRVHYFLLFCIAACAGLGFAHFKKRASPVYVMLVGIGVCLLIIADGSVWIPRHYPSIQREYAYPLTPEIEGLKNLQGQGRVIAREGYFPPNIGMLYNLRDPRGYEVLRPRRYELLASQYLENRSDYYLLLSSLEEAKPFLDLTAVTAILDQGYPGGVRRWENSLPRAYTVGAATRVFDAHAAVSALKIGFDYRTGVLIEKKEPILSLQGPTLQGAQKADIRVDKPEEVVVEATVKQDSWLVLLDSFYPGWNAYVDGKETPLYPANVAFRGVYLPAGNHTVRFIFAPESFTSGIILAPIGIGVLIVTSIPIFLARSRVF